MPRSAVLTPTTEVPPAQRVAPAGLPIPKQPPLAESVDLAVEGAVKTFDGESRVLDDVSFSIPHGQAVALIGHNGSGKSTLLRCCLRLIEPTAGRIRILDSDVSAARGRALHAVRSRVGFIFQQHNLVPRLCALTNVLHGAQARRKGPRVWFQSLARSEDRKEAMHCLDRVGLAHLAERRADQLSGGESQRVAIARALMQRPRIVMADEPVASLDPSAGEEVMRLFLDLIRDEGLTLVFISHNLEHALRYADRILGLRGGRLTLDESAERQSVSDLRGLYD
jgi:phosphonate transport system ATP-binding protein